MPARILIVEDDALQSDLARRVLESQGFYVDVAVDGLEAVQKTLSGWFDIVLMDYLIPELDGLGVARVIADVARSNGRPRLIALSASPAEIQKREAGGQSVFDAIEAKPWNPGELIATILRCHDQAPPAAYRAAQNAQPKQTIAPDEPPRGQVPSSMAPPMPRVLIVEDDGQFRSVLGLGLRAGNYHVDEAGNGLEAVRLAVATQYDVIVVDYHLPEIDGFAVSRLIFDLQAGPARPRLVALTSAPEELIQREGEQLSRFDEIVPKHLGLKPLLAAVDRCAQYKTLRTRLQPPEVVRLDTIIAIGVQRA